MPEVVINHEEARQLAEMNKESSNLARAYLEYYQLIQKLRRMIIEGAI